jgi:opacity protein-like surface antigen
MNKFLVSAVLIVTVLYSSTSSYAADAASRNGYFGIGASYAFEDFDAEKAGNDLEGIARGTDLDFDDAFGCNVTVGYHVAAWLSLEFELNWLSQFETGESLAGLLLPIDLTGALDVTTYMVVAKFTCGLEPLKPFIVVGGGNMEAQHYYEAYDGGLVVTTSHSECGTDVCAKLGLGVDFFVTKRVSVTLEGSYVWGFGDLDAIKYFNTTLGLGYHY